jgi:(1->4)-alpha-D-glucan 1-alpha-D-glucosylmutase
MIPRSTARLQLTREFGFDAARAQVDYFARLGVSHLYLSPIFRATAGSTHGYDAVDFHRVSAELGGNAALEELAAALRERGMGIVLDIVPNHMGVASNDNGWWNDVLMHGERSAYARHFDIDWTPDDRALHGKLLLPFLGRGYSDCLADAELSLLREDGTYRIAYADWRWPLSSESQAEIDDADAFDAHDAQGRERLHALLERQHYRLDSWRTAAERINYRRFFNIAELAALRVDDERVFADVHQEIFALYASGVIDGVRVDHVDGLAHPLEYCTRLREALEERRSQRPLDLRDMPVYIVVEKIFAAREPQRDWGVAGTTGYDFMDQVSGMLHNPGGLAALDILWRRVSGHPWEWREALFDARRQILQESFGADLDRVARAFHALTATSAGHVTYAALKRALTELAVAFPVYRCYGLPGALPPEDAAVLAEALERAVRRLNAEDYEALDVLARCLRDVPDERQVDAYNEAATRFQQLTAPIAAKAIEDTVFYREARLLSRNEVGSDPNVFAVTGDEFHAACAIRSQRFPHGLLATATHDHKRGEDARMRLAVLSDDAERWSETAARWMALNAALRPIAGGSPAPDPVDELMVYQTLVGAWPLGGLASADQLHEFRDRIAQWWLKALREAKRHSNWIAHNAAYEDACTAFLRAILDNSSPFRTELQTFVDSIAAAAALAGLVQTFLRLTTPGVPDLYQGCEFWDFSLVDPDNRRPVDYAARIGALDGEADWPDLARGWRDGRIKLRLAAHLLALRAADPELFSEGSYHPLPVEGARKDHVLAFARRHGKRSAVVAVTIRCGAATADSGSILPPGDWWRDTEVVTDAGRLALSRMTDIPVLIELA